MMLEKILDLRGKDVMIKEPLCVAPETSMVELMSIIKNRKFRGFPVINNKKEKILVGINTGGDLNKYRYIVRLNVKNNGNPKNPWPS